ncbi:MAG TPA: cytidine deaminase [Chryseolinea sp.]|nr:cytidine deaminase [Chryseolinea sp.]
MSDFISRTQSELGEDETVLIAKAEQAIINAYAPYSSFLVGAAVLLNNGVIVTGTNQENAAYPSGMCAERVVLYTASSQYPGEIILKLVVVAKKMGAPHLSPATCCGSCRQVMVEFEQRQENPFKVVMLYSSNEWIIAPSAVSLLPFSFDKSSLGVQR